MEHLSIHQEDTAQDELSQQWLRQLKTNERTGRETVVDSQASMWDVPSTDRGQQLTSRNPTSGRKRSS